MVSRDGKLRTYISPNIRRFHYCTSYKLKGSVLIATRSLCQAAKGLLVHLGEILDTCKLDSQGVF